MKEQADKRLTFKAWAVCACFINGLLGGNRATDKYRTVPPFLSILIIMKKLFYVLSLVVMSISAKAQYPNVFADPYGFQQRVLQEQRQQMKRSMKNFQWNFSNTNQSAPVQSNNNYNNESNTSTQQQQTPQATTRTCGVCHGTGKCNNCVNGWVKRLSGQDGPCPVCPNHNGLCSSCNGRGSWKE